MGKRTVGKFLVSMNCGTVCLFGSVYMEGQWLRLGVPKCSLNFFQQR